MFSILFSLSFVSVFTKQDLDFFVSKIQFPVELPTSLMYIDCFQCIVFSLERGGDEICLVSEQAVHDI